MAVLAKAVGDLKVRLRYSRLAAGQAIVADTSPLAGDSLFQHLSQCAIQPQRLIIREVFCSPQGVDTGSKQGFIGIHIAHPSEEGLIAEQGLDTRRALAQTLSQDLGGEARL